DPPTTSRHLPYSSAGGPTSCRKWNSRRDKKDVMVAIGIIWPEFGCFGHHRYLSLPHSHAIGPVLVELQRRKTSATQTEIQPNLVSTYIQKEENDHVCQNRIRCARWASDRSFRSGVSIRAELHYFPRCV